MSLAYSPSHPLDSFLKNNFCRRQSQMGGLLGLELTLSLSLVLHKKMSNLKFKFDEYLKV